MTTMAMETGSVLLPAFNEAGTVGNSLLRIAGVLEQQGGGRTWEIIVVDDGSIDTTADEADSAGAHLATRGIRVHVVRHVVNRGLGAALQTAFAASSGDVVVVVDCDLSYAPHHIPRLVDALVEGQAKVAIASPYMSGGSTVGVPRHIEQRSRIANRFLCQAVHGEIETLTGMVRAYDGAFIRGLALKSPDTDINLEVIYKTQILRGRIVEIPATLDWSGLESRAGRTRIADAKTRAKIYKTLIDGVLFRPFVLFGVGGVALVFGGVAVGLVAMMLVGPQVELTVLAICALTTGVTLCFAGLLSIQIKRCFEELFFLGSRDRVGAAAVETPAPSAPSVVLDRDAPDQPRAMIEASPPTSPLLG